MDHSNHDMKREEIDMDVEDKSFSQIVEETST